MTPSLLCIIFFSLAFSSKPLKAQPYRLNGMRDVSIWALSGTHYWINKNWENRIPLEGNYWRTVGFDKWAPTELTKPLAWASDFTANACFTGFGALGFFLPQDARLGYWQLGAQNVLLTANITQSIKMTARRARPFNQPGYNFDHKDQFYSFLSGHSSTTAAAATTAWLAMREYPDLRLTANIIGYSTAALAVSTATLRVAAGKHYPSDVIAGIALGVGVSVLNQKIHERF